uniref:Variant surface glycoprotein 1125.2765 n=1 Tax=Trypanosoma brucei TaxID=5691 RepID=A0A1J0R8S2_9TRYP|nr:variant surface glycoprotein 1125.2765 [Trypanosoma brucei]
MPLKGVIAKYAEAAFDIQEAEKTKVPAGHTDDQLKTLIKTAVYGHNGGYNVSKKAELGFPDSENREAACTAQSNSNPVKTIAGMVACLCTVKDNMAPAKAPCGPYGWQDLKWGTTTPPGNALWKKMRSSCPEEPKKPVTAMRIQNALTAAKLAFQAGASDLYVGKYDGTGCDGGTNTACIKHTNQAQNAVPIFTKAEWLDKLQTVQSDLQQRLLAEQSKSQVIRQIETLKQLFKAATKHAEKLTPPTTQHHSDPKLAIANDKNSQAQKTTDCSKLEKAECKPDLGCKYNETTTKCENDAQNPVSKTNKEATGGANAEGKKCSEKTKQEDCKDDCKWKNNA